jgi:hypothetical protein
MPDVARWGGEMAIPTIKMLRQGEVCIASVNTVDHKGEGGGCYFSWLRIMVSGSLRAVKM